MDTHQPPENGCGVQHPTAGHRHENHRQVPRAVRGRQDIPRPPLYDLPARNPRGCQTVRHHEASHVASEPSYGSDNGIPLQRRAHRNGQFHARTQEHKDHADIRQDYEREAQPGHGKPGGTSGQGGGVRRM